MVLAVVSVPWQKPFMAVGLLWGLMMAPVAVGCHGAVRGRVGKGRRTPRKEARGSCTGKKKWSRRKKRKKKKKIKKANGVGRKKINLGSCS